MGKFQTLCKSTIVILTWGGFSALATVYDSDGSSINVQYIHDILAQNGDTITPVEVITLTAYRPDRNRSRINLDWDGATGPTVSVYRNGVFRATITNDGYS